MKLGISSVVVALLSFLNSAYATGAGKEAIRINVDSAPVTLEPPILTETAASWILHHIGDRLVEEHQMGQVRGNLAQQWTISKDKKRFSFKIVKGRSFSDGSALTPESVAKSFNLAMAHKDRSRVGAYLKNVDSVTSEGDVVVIQLKEASANFLQVLADASFTVYKSCKAPLGWCFTSPNFHFKQLNKDSVLIERVGDKQIFRLISMPFADAFAKFKNGELEILRNYGVENLEAINSLTERRSVMYDERSYFLALNQRSSALDTTAKRAALKKAVNYEGLKVKLADHKIGLTDSLLSPSIAFSPSTLSKNIGSAEVAKNKPKIDSGAIKVLAIESHKLQPFSKVIFSNLNANFTEVPRKQFFETLKIGSYDVILIGYGVTVKDWDYLSTLFHSASSHNFAKVNDGEIDKLLSEARAESNPKIRMNTYREILEINNKENYYIPLFNVPLVHVYSQRTNPGFTSAIDRVTTPFVSLNNVTFK